MRAAAGQMSERQHQQKFNELTFKKTRRSYQPADEYLREIQSLTSRPVSKHVILYKSCKVLLGDCIGQPLEYLEAPLAQVQPLSHCLTLLQTQG